jgi:nucleotide-binding universal stress UspA family protein
MELDQVEPATESRTMTGDAPERILLAVDGKAASLTAARWTAARAARRPTIVTLTYLAGDLHGAGVLDAGPTRAEHVVWKEREYLNELARTAKLRTHVLTGSREDALREAAARHTDLLVLGSNRVDGKPRVPVPSISTRIAAAPVVPTVVVPRTWTPGEGPVVVGIDTDVDDAVVVAFAAAEAAVTNSRLIIVHGAHLPWERRPALLVTSDDEAWRIAAQHRLRDIAAATSAGYPGLDVRTEVRDGHPADVLRTLAYDASLLVVGAHRVTPDSECLLGSVGRAVVAEPPCPVAVVPAGIR